MNGASPSAQRRSPSWGLGDVLAGFAIALVASSLVGSIVIVAAGWQDVDGTMSAPMWGVALLQIPLWAGYLGVSIYAGRAKGSGVVADFGLRSTLGDAPLGAAIGVAMQLVVVPILYIPILRLSGSTSEDLSAPAREMADRAGSPWGWVLFALIVGVGAPLVEELFYRGLFLRSLQRRGISSVGAVVISSFVFGAAHMQPLQFVGLFTFGLVLGTLTVWSGRLGPAIWAHLGFNLTTVVVLYLGA